MKKPKLTESPIVAITAQQEQGMRVTDICREHGISQPTFYQWQKKYSGMKVSELKRMEEMEAEISEYKRIVAELTLPNTVLKDVIKKGCNDCRKARGR